MRIVVKISETLFSGDSASVKPPEHGQRVRKSRIYTPGQWFFKRQKPINTFALIKRGIHRHHLTNPLRITNLSIREIKLKLVGHRLGTHTSASCMSDRSAAEPSRLFIHRSSSQARNKNIHICENPNLSSSLSASLVGAAGECDCHNLVFSQKSPVLTFSTAAAAATGQHRNITKDSSH